MKRPDDLGPRGLGFWEATVARVDDLGMDLTTDEREILTAAVRTLDEIDGLEEAIRKNGVTVDGSRGQQVAHPALSAVRAHRVVLGQLLKQLDLPEEPEPETARSSHPKRRRR